MANPRSRICQVCDQRTLDAVLHICVLKAPPSARTKLQDGGRRMSAVRKNTTVKIAINQAARGPSMSSSPASLYLPSGECAETPTIFISATNGMESMLLPTGYAY